MAYFRRIDRIVWKPINWLPESPDQYPDGLPPSFKPESVFVPLAGGGVLWVEGHPLAPTMKVFVNWCPGHLRPVSSEEMPPEMRAAYTWAEAAELHTDDDGNEFTVFAPGGEYRQTLELPADKKSLVDIVDALLYIQRRTHEHDWQGPDDGLAKELETNG